MSQVIIENPILNSPFAEPNRHFRFDDEGITDQIEEARRISCYFIPVPKPRKKRQDQQQTFDSWTEDRIEENVTVNAIRQCVKTWREGRYTHDLTRPSARLLEYWQRDDRARPLFCCQIEALETIIYITEVAKKNGHARIENDIRRFNEDAADHRTRTSLETRGQARTLDAPRQGEGWVSLDWKESVDGGKAAAYKIERRQRPSRPWTDAGMAIESEIVLSGQECGKGWQYRVIAVNKAGGRVPSNTVMAVL